MASASTVTASGARAAATTRMVRDRPPPRWRRPGRQLPAAGGMPGRHVVEAPPRPIAGLRRRPPQRLDEPLRRGRRQDEAADSRCRPPPAGRAGWRRAGRRRAFGCSTGRNARRRRPSPATLKNVPACSRSSHVTARIAASGTRTGKSARFTVRSPPSMVKARGASARRPGTAAAMNTGANSERPRDAPPGPPSRDGEGDEAHGRPDHQDQEEPVLTLSARSHGASNRAMARVTSPRGAHAAPGYACGP